ncbi:protein of unknown function [Hyphomicrobium sp. MC1]|nr:protein of unknown function [Hyphomicrobium sp. MC1]
MPIVALFGGLHRVTADDLRQFLNGPLSRRSGHGKDSQDFLDQLLFKCCILPVGFQNSFELGPHRILLESDMTSSS